MLWRFRKSLRAIIHAQEFDPGSQTCYFLVSPFVCRARQLGRPPRLFVTGEVIFFGGDKRLVKKPHQRYTRGRKAVETAAAPFERRKYVKMRQGL